MSLTVPCAVAKLHRMAGDGTDVTRVDVLGPLVLQRDGRLLTPASSLQRRILCLLACRAPSQVSVDHLIDVSWPHGALPKEPEQNLQTHISRIRRLCGARPGEAGAIETRPGGYRLAVEELSVDVIELAELTAPGLGPAEDASTLERLTRALALWRGDSLVDIADTDLGRGEAARLDELRLSITEARFECLLATGAQAELVHDVEAFTLEHPYRERTHAVLMQALHDLGRQADALAAYQRLRTRLVEDLGIEPSPELRALEADILGQRLAVRIPAAPPDRSPSAASGPPAPVTPLVGRDDALARAEAAVARSRLVTIVGSGGVGKTRLAMELGQRRSHHGPDPRSVVWCDLTAATDGPDLTELVARALGARRQPDETARAATIRAAARDEPFLILDNCEQVIEPSAALVAELLAASGGVRVLATSRGPLDIAGEDLVRLEPLRYEPLEGEGSSRLPPAAALFLARSAATGTELDASDTTLDQVVRVCRAVDGLPLGVELAAAQLRNMTLRQLADRMGQELGPLDVARRRGPVRHRSVRSTLEWSYHLLDTADRRLLAAISIFSGSFGPTAAARISRAGDARSVSDRLSMLSDLSLLSVEPTENEMRFRLLETTRSFGRELLVRDGVEAALSARHREWVRDLLDAHATALRGPEEEGAARSISLETDNVRAAVGRAATDGDAGAALAICCSLDEFAFQRLRDDVYGWTERALAIEGADDHGLFGRALATLALGLTSRGDLLRAEACARQALGAAPQDEIAAVAAHHALALAALYTGELPGALAAATTQLEVAESADDDVNAQGACMIAALASAYGGDRPAALDWAERSIGFADRSGAPSTRAWAAYCLGEVLGTADTERAAALFEQAITIGETVDNLFVMGVAEVSLTTLRAAAGDPGAALRTFDQLIRRWVGRNDWTHQWTTLQNVAPLLTRSGSPAEAAVLVGALTANVAARPLFGDAADRISHLEGELADQLGAAAFQRHRARGAALSPREIVAFVLSLTGRGD